MITVEEAYKLVMDHKLRAYVQEVDIEIAQGRVLAEEIKADRDFPPFDRVTMDGIAIQYNTFRNGIRNFPISSIAAAGAEQQILSNLSGCIEVMTGAVMPLHADTVIRYEDLNLKDNVAEVQLDQLNFRQNIHFQGSDRKKGEILLRPGKLIGAPEIAVMSTVGKQKIKIYRPPSVAVISSGDELVDIHIEPLPHQIRKSNNYSIGGALNPYHCPMHAFHMPDDPEIILKQLHDILEVHDIIILSGGVSKGKFDFIPEALTALKVKKLFHRIMQRPGKPFWFGIAPGDKPVFALPGNPVSSFMCTNKYILPWLRQYLHMEESVQYAVLGSDVTFKPDLNYFVQVKLETAQDGRWMATPIEGNGSGDFANLTDADAFMELPKGKDLYEKGEVHQVFYYR